MMYALTLIGTGIASAVATFYLNAHAKQGAVRASALLAFVVALFFHLFPTLVSMQLTQAIPAVCIGASFIGMVSHKVFKNIWLIALSGGIFSIIFLNTSSFFTGYGGALGTSACISLLTAMSLPVFFAKHRWKNGFALLRKRLFGK